jgi:hypothetical protein
LLGFTRSEFSIAGSGSSRGFFYLGTAFELTKVVDKVVGAIGLGGFLFL